MVDEKSISFRAAVSLCPKIVAGRFDAIADNANALHRMF